MLPGGAVPYVLREQNGGFMVVGECPISGHVGGPKVFPFDRVYLDSEESLGPLEDFVVR